MGSLDSRIKLQSRALNLPDDVDQVFVREQAERKIVAMRNRLELEIAAWIESVSFQLTKVGKDLLKEVEISVNQMVIEYSRGEMRSHEELDIKFIPRSLQKSEVGFLCHGSLLPSSLSLELLTAIPDLRVGARITLAMGVEGESRISPLVRRHLALSVHTEAAEQVPCQEVSKSEDGRSLLVSFETHREGQFIATATLYKQHVVGSPLVIPVLVSPGTVLEDMGLMATGLPAHHVPPGTAPGQQAAASPSSPCKPVAKGRELDVSNKYVMGAFCFAKWGNDGVWYKAKIDKDCLERGVEVTFVDYDNSDFVQRGNIVWTKEELPEGAIVDLGQDVLCVGDVVIAKWDVDDVWYNAKVLSQESGGYSVLFIDYENVAFVESDKICSEVTDIPEGECLDSNVEMLLEPQELKENVVTAENVHLVPQWSVGNDCLARWVEDGRWYNAIVDTVFESSSVMSTVQYLVTFTDYGNSEIVTEDDMAADVEAVGVDQHDLLDENVVITPESFKEEVSLHQPTTNEERTRKPLVRTNFEFDAVPTKSQQTKNPIESRIFDNVPAPSSRCKVFEKGSKVIAKRDEEGTWHRAVIHEVVAAGKLYIVKYEDCGQFGGAGPSNIVLEAKDVPEGEKVADEVILRKDDEMKAVWSTGEACIARWSQDNVWYNGQVLSVGVGGSFIVRFVDYGNEDNVVEEDMVRTVLEIPGDSFVDENVDQNIEEEKYQLKSEIVVPEFSARTDQISMTIAAPPASRPLKPGSQDQVRLLASAVSASAESCQGAPGQGAAARGVQMTREVSARKVPASLQCCLCGNVCRKGMRLTCNSSPVCWGCAVKEITRGHVCWQCGARNITTDSHLVRDQVLRSLVDQFITTGKLDPAHEQALRNGQVLPAMKADRVKEEPRELERSASSVKIKKVGVSLNDACLVKASEDGVWYNGVVTDVYGDRSALVYFMDYGNSERVKFEDIVGGVEDVPHGEVVDANVHQMISAPIMPGQTEKLQACNTKLDFLSVATLGPDGVAVLAAQETLVIKDLAGPIGVTVLADGSLAVVCRGDNCVSRYSMGGEFLENIIPGREFVKPSDILTLASGEVAVRDERGIQLFDGRLQFVQFVAEEWIDRCFGLAEDDEGRIITINCNANCVESLVKITNSGCTDVFFIDVAANKVIKRIEMVDLIEDSVELLKIQPEMSACRFLAYCNNKLYVVDLGLDCVYILNKDGTESELFGSRGNKGGEFRDPAGLAVDDSGTMMVVDSRNHRLQLIDNGLSFAGMVKVDKPLARPSGILVDRVNRAIFVSNYLGRSVVRYKMVPT